ncbi:MAG TPA: hypothetical protein VFP40_02815 [Terriglobales bacterium]|nr:hypothetical protein [Terriglobales bacterium]
MNRTFVIPSLVLVLLGTMAAQTQNYVAKFNTGGTIVNSSLFDNGNLGIGTAAPRNIVDIIGSNAVLNIDNRTFNAGTVGLQLLHVNGEGNQQKVAIFSDATGYWGKGNLRFAVNTTDNESNVSLSDTRLFIDANTGNIGVATTTPGQKLEVNGNLKLSAGSGGRLYFPDGTSQGSAATGTITGVLPGGGLTGGGYSGNVVLGVDSTVARTSSSQSFTGNQTIYGNLALGITNGSGGGFSANGGAWVSNNYGGTPFYIVCVNLGTCLYQSQNGSLSVTGYVYKAGGTFKIDHPLDPANKFLYHSFVESPDMKNIYDGIVMLDDSGEAWVSLPDWFEALNRDFRYQLTAIGAPPAGIYIASEISGNKFKVAGGAPKMKVSWQVTGIRQDAYAKAHPLPVEEDKPKEYKGYYLHPQEFNQPVSLGIGTLQGKEGTAH